VRHSKIFTDNFASPASARVKSCAAQSGGPNGATTVIHHTIPLDKIRLEGDAIRFVVERRDRTNSGDASVTYPLSISRETFAQFQAAVIDLVEDEHFASANNDHEPLGAA
jgi:phosphotransferase system IIA component